MRLSPNKSFNKPSVPAMIEQDVISDPLLSPPLSAHLPSPTPSAPLSSPPSTPIDRRPSPTLSEMMSEEQAPRSKKSIETLIRIRDRMFNSLWASSLWRTADIWFTVAPPGAIDFGVPMELHREVLVRRSGFFAEKLRGDGPNCYILDVPEHEDLEFYVEALLLMHSEEDLKTKLAGLEASEVLQLLKVSLSLSFHDAVTACLQYLEAIPRFEDEIGKVKSCVTVPLLRHSVLNELQRMVAGASTSSRANDVSLEVSSAVLQTMNDKAQTQETSETSIYRNRLHVSKDTLYHLCHRCLNCLVLRLSEATRVDDSRQDCSVIMKEIAGEAANLECVVHILVDGGTGDVDGGTGNEFMQLCADQKQLSNLHSKVSNMAKCQRTAELCPSIGGGQIFVPKESLYSLLSTWFEAVCEDFGSFTCSSAGKKQVEEVLNDMVLTLPFALQKDMLLKWADVYLKKGDDCLNLRRAYKIWRGRSLSKHSDVQPSVRITASAYSG